MSLLRYAITDRTQYAETEPKRHASLVAQASRLAAEGVDYIQLREKDLPAQDLIGLAREILSVIRETRSGTRLLINSRADIALAAGAHGVHLPSGEEQLTPEQIRHLFLGHQDNSGRHSDPELAEGEASPPFSYAATGSKLIVSVSCHTLDDVGRARKSGADLILFGPVFGKSIAGEIVVPETGLAALQSACDAAGETPVLALGGITTANTAACIDAGASGIAAIRLFR
jgi:thiamine-phosphate pyrophosphorylase